MFVSLSYTPPVGNVILLVTGDEQNVNQRATLLAGGSGGRKSKPSYDCRRKTGEEVLEKEMEGEGTDREWRSRSG